jgi:orotate phosphoribosyltransferase
MTDDALAIILTLAQARDGHFRMESGYHAGRWLELAPLFVEPGAIRPVVTALAGLLRPFAPDAICGPMTGGALVAQMLAIEMGCEFYLTERTGDDGSGLYRARYVLPDGLKPRLCGRRVALVDDVISAGSSVRASHAALMDAGAVIVAVGALMLMGDAAPAWFGQRDIPVVAPAKTQVLMWKPEECPLCAQGVTLETPV